ncbi:MAG: hypothetical protein FWF97_04760 [Alphaproteobacteria bacterium]|nr:hypothetical protein [Alphaproteobacteria bacterium]
MNIFIMILVFVLMAGYYLIDAPSQRIGNDTLESALRTTEVKSVLSCMARAHAAAIDLDTAVRAEAKEALEIEDMPCMEKYNVESVKLCADERREVAVCTPDRAGRTIGNFIVTIADMPDETDANLILKTLSSEYEAAPNFGLVLGIDNKSFAILSGNGHRRAIPASIASAAKLQDGQIIYITQYSATAPANLGAPKEEAENILCMFGEQKIFRFNKWECIPINPPAACPGDTIFRSETGICEPDFSRRPLCAGGETAVQVDDLWECIEPTPDRVCPGGRAAQLDYVTLEWVCGGTEAQRPFNKCAGAMIAKGRISGGTVLKPGNICNNCEKMIMNEETCDITCIPDATKVNQPACYARAAECMGATRAFYFGFPSDPLYIEAARANLPELAGMQIPNDGSRSQNRKFNCLDCGVMGRINRDLSRPPFVAVCE